MISNEVVPYDLCYNEIYISMSFLSMFIITNIIILYCIEKLLKLHCKEVNTYLCSRAAADLGRVVDVARAITCWKI